MGRVAEHLLHRARPYKKNDQATIESKNNHLVRRYGFYWRYDTPSSATVSLNTDGTWLATTSWDRTARIWDPTTGQLLASLRLAAHCDHLAYMPPGRIVVAANHHLYAFKYVGRNCGAHT